MKASLVLSLALPVVAAAAIAAANADADALVRPELPLAFSGDEQASSCHGYTTKDKCVQNHCVWCMCAAVPSSCYTPEEADQLPPAVFQCDKGVADTVSWEITQAPSGAMELDTLFASWMRVHDKQYASVVEKELRKGIFEVNARSIAEHNTKGDASFTMELNEFADTTWEEFQEWYLGSPQSCSATSSPTSLAYGEVPEAKDWRADGMVSPVKNQGKCGSCWTFSTTGCLESHLKLKHGQFTILSEQNLLDCAQAFDNHGCNGGLPSHAFEFVKYNGGLDTEDSYPYEAKEGKCKFNTYHVGAQVQEVVNITARDETQLKAAVGSVGPVSIAFQVVSDFRFYKSGVYESANCKSGEKDVNHAVLAVGYGVEAGKKHWIVKNSWGAAWGMDGFFQIARDRNMCGVADCASYPIVA